MGLFALAHALKGAGELPTFKATSTEHRELHTIHDKRNIYRDDSVAKKVKPKKVKPKKAVKATPKQQRRGVIVKEQNETIRNQSNEKWNRLRECELSY